MNRVGSEFGHCGIHGREKINPYGCASCQGGAAISSVNGGSNVNFGYMLWCTKHNTRYAVNGPGCPLCLSEKGLPMAYNWNCSQHDWASDTEKCPECVKDQSVLESKLCGDPDPMQTQIGGDHYKKMKIQPMEFSMANGLDACQHTIIKYVTRFRDKGGIADLEKARHVIDMLIQFEKDK